MNSVFINQVWSTYVSVPSSALFDKYCSDTELQVYIIKVGTVTKPSLWRVYKMLTSIYVSLKLCVCLFDELQGWFYM